MGEQPFGHPQVLVGDLARLHPQLIEHPGEDPVLVVKSGFDLFAKDGRVEKVLNPDAGAGELVGVGRADAAFGGSDLVSSQVALHQRVEFAVVGHDQVGVARDAQLFRRDSPAFEHGHFFQQHLGIDDTAGADHRGALGIENSRGDEREGDLLVPDDDGVTGVVAPLIADHKLGGLGEIIGNPTFPFVSPLGAEDDGGGHLRAR